MFNKLSVHHVGGRNGSQPFPPAESFDKDIVNVLYDADPDCIDHAREQNATRQAELYVLPYCIADASRKINFNLNRDPFTSTNCEMNPEIASFYFFSGGHTDYHQNYDYVYGEAATPIKKLELSAVSLDDLFHGDKNKIPAPDFLSLDTDGSEYGILQGAEETLKSVLAVYTEIEFQHIFKNGYVFGDIAHLLHDKGFLFVGFYESGKYSPYRAPVGLRGDGFLFNGCALFLRAIDHLGRSGTEATALRTQLRKLAFIAVLYSQMEYALECLRHARNFPEVPASEPLVYERFLSELEACAARVPKAYPPTFAEVFSVERSPARFDAKATIAAKQKGTLKGFLKSLPVMGPALVHTWRGLLRLNSAVHRIWHTPVFNADSEVERLLRRYGLKPQATILKRNRLEQAPSSRLVASRG